MGDARMPAPSPALDHESTIVAAVELSAPGPPAAARREGRQAGEPGRRRLRGGPGRLLAGAVADRAWDRGVRDPTVERSRRASGAAGEDRRAGRRDAVAHHAGLAAGRAAGVLDGADPERGGGGRPPAAARAAGPDPGAAGDSAGFSNGLLGKQ